MHMYDKNLTSETGARSLLRRDLSHDPIPPLPPVPQDAPPVKDLPWWRFPVALLRILRNKRMGDMDLAPLPRKSTAAGPTAVPLGQPLRLVSWNLGFGAYSQEFSFFLDAGKKHKQKDYVRGRYARAISLDDVRQNTRGQAAALQALDPDFILLQEVDHWSTRSYYVDQIAYLMELFPEKHVYYARNHRLPFMPFPRHEHIGEIDTGLLDLSSFPSLSARRLSLPLGERGIRAKKDLDRCMLWQRYETSEPGRFLNIINVHFSAFDRGGVSRRLQFALVHDLLTSLREKGEEIILAGDFNQELDCGRYDPNDKTDFSRSPRPLTTDFLPEGMRLIPPSNLDTGVRSCRASNTAYVPGETMEYVLDHCFVTDGIEAVVGILDLDYANSDHQPLVVDFQLLPTPPGD